MDFSDDLLDEIAMVFPSSPLAICVIDNNTQTVTLDRCRPAELYDEWKMEIQRLLPPDHVASVMRQGHPVVCRSHSVRSRHPEIQAVVLMPVSSLRESFGVVLVGLHRAEASALDLRVLAALTRQTAFTLECARGGGALRQENALLKETIRRQTSELGHASRAVAQLNHELEAALKKTLEMGDRLALADRVRESLLATVSHELRTPLSALLGSLDLFREEWNERLPPEARRLLDVCERNSAALFTLISDWLEVASLRSAPPVLLKQPIRLAAFVQDTFKIVALLARANGVRLDNTVAAEVEVFADRQRLRQVLLHLEGNAIKFRGAADPYVQVNAVVEEKRILISVRDNGVGIAPEKIAYIFEPFVQGEDSYTSPTTGAGLGLSICKSIIEHHGGAIWVESEVGRGSCFSFSLPYALKTTDR